VPARELIVGSDFSGARGARDQRRKIIALAAIRDADGRYTIAPDGFNARVLATPRQPGWTAAELADTLVSGEPARVAAFDFPFSIPAPLLDDPAFAARVGHDGAFGSWAAFNRFVAARLPLTPPLDFTPLAPWRDKTLWQKRATDRAASAQPPLKSVMPVLFNMTLLGNALLAALAASGGYRIRPFDEQAALIGGATGETGPANEVVEIYPALTMRGLGFRGYKRDPVGAIATALAGCAARGIAVTLDPALRRFCEVYTTAPPPGRDPDASDALIALLTAILHREGQTAEVLPAEAAALRPIEGAVWGLRADTGPMRDTTVPVVTNARTMNDRRLMSMRRRTTMRDESRAFLHGLLEAAGPSNYEIAAARVWRAEAAKFCAEVTPDVNGNTIARLRGAVAPGAKKVVLCGHIDEIGLIVTHVNGDGTLAFRGIGGWDVPVLIGQRIRILARGGDVTGVIGRKAIHLMRDEDRDRAARLDDLWIDIGAADKEAAAARVRVGDAAVIDVLPVMLSDDLIASRALDDRCCAFIALETLRLLSEGEAPWCDVYAAATVQEEITLRGAHTVAATLAPDVAIALDVTHASDRPGVAPQEVGEHGCGSGAAILRGGVANELLVDLLIATAAREGLSHTLEPSGGRSGTDADALVLNGRGTAGAVISVPCRYMHSPVEVVSLADVETCAKLLAATIRAIGPETSFVPE